VFGDEMKHILIHGIWL